MLLIGVIGLFMVVSASMDTNVIYITLIIQAIKQIMFLILGYIGYVILSKYIHYPLIKHLIKIIMWVSIGLLIIPLFEAARNGAKAWITIPGLDITLQPSEFVKLSLIWVLVSYLADYPYKRRKFSEVVLVPGIFFGVVIAIVLVLQSDLGSAVIIAGIGLSTFLIISAPQLKRTQVVLLGLFLFLALVLLPLLLSETGLGLLEAFGLKGYMLNRFKVAIDPFYDQYGAGYQLINGLVAMVRGGLFGVGYGNGLAKYGYLPAAKTDYILSIIAEEFGFVGLAILFILYFTLLYRILLHTFKAKSEKNRIVLFGVFMYISLHFIFNVGGVTGLIPLTGVPLLMVSSGGSSTLAMMFGLGMVQHAIIDEYKSQT